MKTKKWKSIQPGNDIWYLIGPEYIKGAKLPTGLMLFSATVRKVELSDTIYGEGRRFVTKNTNFWINNSDLNGQVVVAPNTDFGLYVKTTIYGTSPITVLKSYKGVVKEFLEKVHTAVEYITEICIKAINASGRLKDLIEDTDPKEYSTVSNIKIGENLYGVPLAKNDMNNTDYNVTVLKLTSINSTGNLVFTEEGGDKTITIPKSQTDQRTYFTRDDAWCLSKNRSYKYLQENAINYFNEGQKDLEEFEDLENFGDQILKLINDEIVKKTLSNSYN